eukprot:c14016_g2_i1 orf=135-305(+)
MEIGRPDFLSRHGGSSDLSCSRLPEISSLVTKRAAGCGRDLPEGVIRSSSQESRLI